MRTQIKTALQASGITDASGTVFAGWPTPTELSKIIAQNNGKTQVTLWPLKGKSSTAYSPDDAVNIQFDPVNITASLSEDLTVLTLEGTPSPGVNIHSFFGFPTLDANIGPLIGTETLDALAAAIAARVEGMAVSGVTAVAVGNQVTIAGAYWAYVNIGGTATMTQEVAREARSVQCSVWAPNADIREQVGNAIIAGVGGTNNPRLTMSDGNILLCLYDNDMWWDKAESSYSTYRWDIFFDIEYAISQTARLVQVEGFTVSQSLDDLVVPTLHFGEP